MTQPVGSSTLGRAAGGTAVTEPTTRSGTTTQPDVGDIGDAVDALADIHAKIFAWARRGADTPVWDSMLDQFGTALAELRQHQRMHQDGAADGP